MRFSIDGSLQFYGRCAVLLNSQLGELFKTTVGVHQGCLLSPILFNLFLEKMMQETLHGHHTTTYLRWWEIHTQLRFADDIDLIRGSNGELQDLIRRLVDRATAYGMEVSTKKSKIMTNCTNQHQCRCWHEQREVRTGDQLEIPLSNPEQKWHMFGRSLRQDCLSNCSNG